jgi:hypothetical protein
MRPPEDLRQLQLSHFPDFQQSVAADRLDEVADKRLASAT